MSEVEEVENIYLEIALSKKLILEMNSLRDYAKSVEVR